MRNSGPLLVRTSLFSSHKQVGTDLTIINRGRLREEELLDIFCIADIGVTPSLCLEPGPFTTIEFILARTLVIASALGGNTEFIQHGKNGILIEHPNDVESWGKELSYWIENETARTSIVGGLDHSDFEDYCNTENYISRWHRLITSIN